MKKRFFRFVPIVLAAAFISGCSTDYDWSTDHVQIGCRYRKYERYTPPEVSCFRFGFPWWYDAKRSGTIYGIDLSPFIMDGGELNGLGISLASGRQYTNGVIVAPLLSVQEKTNGASFSLINFSKDYSPGLQVGLANFNIPFYALRGGTWVQLGLLNMAEEAEVQLGVINEGVSKKEKRQMLQIGLVNSSQNGILQLGLLNRNCSSCFCTWFPFFNFSQRIFGL